MAERTERGKKEEGEKKVSREGAGTSLHLQSLKPTWHFQEAKADGGGLQTERAQRGHRVGRGANPIVCTHN